MTLDQRIGLLEQLGAYLRSGDPALEAAKEKAFEKNKWFTPEFTGLAIRNICEQFLDPGKLRRWVAHYHLDDRVSPKTIGIVMAGNIPLVGFQDFLCAFMSGHRQRIKLSDRDAVLLPFLLDRLRAWEPAFPHWVGTAEILKGCDAYIATGSNNSSRYFRHYFGRYPSILRGNRTSVAVLDGSETPGQLALLADDIQSYFGLGCRNVSALFVPRDYSFAPLLGALEKYRYFMDHPKYRNNYDYQLALLIMNGRPYMTNDSVLFVEQEVLFAPVSEVHYTFYGDKNVLLEDLKGRDHIQCIAGAPGVPFGKTQEPGLSDYADGVDVMQFLMALEA